MKHKIQHILVCLLAIVLLICPAAALTFPDVDDNSDYAKAIKYVSDLGIMIGDEKGNFNPGKTVTRAEMATIVCRMLGKTENLSELSLASIFPDDVSEFHWARDYIAMAAYLGIVNGYDAFNFGPNDIVTCEQAATILVRASLGETEASALGGYPDGYWSVAQKYGLLDNMNLQQTTGMTRANVAMMIYNWSQAVRSSKLASDPTVGQKGNAKAGTYCLDEGYAEPHTLRIYRLCADGTMMFSVNWFRFTGLDHVKAILNGNRATFNYSDGYTTASGYIDFSSDSTAALTITNSNSYYLSGMRQSIFQFESNSASIENDLMDSLCQNTATVGWIGRNNEGPYSSYDRYLLRFHENGNVNILHEISAGVDWDIKASMWI